jgi:SAM-dependent methyltransferase
MAQRGTSMRKLIYEFVGLCKETLPFSEPIYEFGSFQAPGQEGMDLRHLFSGQKYVGCDMREGPGVNRILNLHHLDLPPATVGTALVLDTLEHVEFPHQALKEVERVLQPNGMAILSSHMNFPIHDYPNDYWRFTPEAFKSLLKPFSHSFVGFAGREHFPHTVIGLGFKNPSVPLESFKVRYEAWMRRWRRKPFKTMVFSLAPQLLLDLQRRRNKN